MVAYIPLGLDFKLTNKGDNLLQKTHIIYEFRPGINTQFGQFGHYATMQWQHNFGVKFWLI